jgi:putative membrane protein
MVEWIRVLPTVNASLNALSATFLLAGYYFIRGKQIARHRAMMIAASCSSVVFLTSYVIYHYHARATKFGGSGWIRPVYFFILITHVILAAAVVPFVIATLSNALRNRIPQHRRIARVTFPIWMYVSITGVIVYAFLRPYY